MITAIKTVQSTTGFGGTGGQGVAAPRSKAQLLEEPAGSVEPPAAEPPEELLRAVADEKQPDRRTCQKAKRSRYESFLSSLSVEDA
jgi:hypothetical protein